MKKVIKAKDFYGPVLERVKQSNMAKVQQENDTADPPPPGGKSCDPHTIELKLIIVTLIYIFIVSI